MIVSSKSQKLWYWISFLTKKRNFAAHVPKGRGRLGVQTRFAYLGGGILQRKQHENSHLAGPTDFVQETLTGSGCEKVINAASWNPYHGDHETFWRLSGKGDNVLAWLTVTLVISEMRLLGRTFWVFCGLASCGREMRLQTAWLPESSLPFPASYPFAPLHVLLCLSGCEHMKKGSAVFFRNYSMRCRHC